jgi:hypothetical protein
VLSFCKDASTEGRFGVATDGEADAARSWSSRLGVPTAGDGDGFVKGWTAGLVGFWNGSVSGSGG